MREIFKTLHCIKVSLISKRSVCRVYPKTFNSANSCFKILRLLYLEGYITNYSYNKIDNIIYITHNYYKNIPTLSVLQIYNKASFPTYIKYTDLVTIHKFGIELLILSTTQGLMPHYKALKKHLGGRVICYLR